MGQTMSLQKPVIGVGSCLVGNPVRYNGEHKRSNAHLERLRDFFELTPFCPEVGIGMGVPREPIRLVGTSEQLRAMDSKSQTHDFTEPLRQYADALLSRHAELAGYVLVKGSPSCGMERVNRYSDQGAHAGRDGVGIFAHRLMSQSPLLPVEEDGRLHDPALRESFVCRVYTWNAWQQLMAGDFRLADLLRFWASHKYLVLARDNTAYRTIGRLLANHDSRPVNELAEAFIHLLMPALARPASRKGHTNALQHVKGYLKKHLGREESQDIDRCIEQYRLGLVPLVVPITLLRHQFRKYPNPYIDQQLFLMPYPDELSLRNHI